MPKQNKPLDSSELLDLLKLFIVRYKKFEKYCIERRREEINKEKKIRYDQRVEDSFMVVYELEQIIKKVAKQI